MPRRAGAVPMAYARWLTLTRRFASKGPTKRAAFIMPFGVYRGSPKPNPLET